MTAPVVNTVFVPGTTITHEWLNGVNDYVNESNPADHSAANVEYQPAGTGATTTTVQNELQKTYHSDNYSDVNTALIAADTTLLQVDSGDGSWLDQGGVGMGVTYNIVPNAPVNIQVENANSTVPYGVYRKYEHDTTNGTLTKSSQLIVNDVTVTNTTTPNSAVGMNLSTQIHVDAPGNFAWHNLQNYVESDAGAPTEIAGTYTFVEASNGASPEGAFYGAMASGTVPYNLMYGMQVSTVDTNTGGVYGSGAKTLSIRHLGTRSAPNGSILFGSGGFVQGYTATNKGERLEAENWASGEGGGSLTYAFMADNTDRTKGAFTAGKSNLVVGSTITGASSGQTAVLRGINITSGSLAGNDAVGTIYVSAASGAFTAGEALQIGGVTAATNGSGNLLTPAGTIGTGFCAANITANAFSVTDSAYGAYWRVTGTGQVGRTIQVFTLADTTPSVKYGDYYQTATDAAGTNITNLLNGVAGQEITIVGGGGASPSVIKNNANIVLASGDWTATNNKVLKLLYKGVWVEISRT